MPARDLFDACSVTPVATSAGFQLVTVPTAGLKLFAASFRNLALDEDPAPPTPLVRLYDATELTDVSDPLGAQLRGFYYLAPDGAQDLNYDLTGGLLFMRGLLIVSTAFATWTADPANPDLTADGPPVLGVLMTKAVTTPLSPSSVQR